MGLQIIVSFEGPKNDAAKQPNKMFNVEWENNNKQNKPLFSEPNFSRAEKKKSIIPNFSLNFQYERIRFSLLFFSSSLLQRHKFSSFLRSFEYWKQRLIISSLGMQETEVKYREILISDGTDVVNMRSDSMNEEQSPNNDMMVEAFRNLLLLHGQLPSKHGDHITLLR